MRGRRFLITGCGRSGTGYMAALMDRLGIECGHEILYEVGRLEQEGPPAWTADHRGESSWLAAPFLETVPADTVVLHQVRHPLAVVRSFVRQNFFGSRHAWQQFAVRHCPVLGEHMPLESSFLYWTRWNRLVERAAELPGLEYFRYRLEDVDAGLVEGILERIGHPRSTAEIEAALADISPRTNTAGDRSKDSLRWDALSDAAISKGVSDLAARFGYDTALEASSAAR